MRSKPRSASRFTGKIIARLSRLATETKTVPLRGSPPYRAVWLFANAGPKSVSMPMTSPVERISGPEQLSTTLPSRVRNRLNGSTASLTAIGAWAGSVPPSPCGGSMPSSRSSAIVAPSMTRAAALASGTPVALATNGTVRRRPGVGLEDVEDVLGQGELDVHQARGRRSPRASLSVDSRTRSSSRPAERHRRQRAGRVAGVDAGLLDVLHDPAEVHLGRRRTARRRRSRWRRRGTGRRAPGARALAMVARRDVARRGSRRRRRSPCRGRRARRTGGPAPGSRSRAATSTASSALYAVPCWGAGRFASARTRPNAPRSSARSIASGRGADDRHALVLERLREPERGLPAELDDDAGDRPACALGVDHLEHVLEGERLEVEPAGGVVVGGDGLGVAVDHHRLEPASRSAKRGVHAGVVELDALADPVRAGAEDDHGRPLARRDLVLLVVGRVVVRRGAANSAAQVSTVL